MSYTRGPGPLQGEHDKLKACVGIVEDGDTNVHAIAQGQYVIWKGDLYTAKSDIQIGTTLSAASGGNLTAKSNGVGMDLTDLRTMSTYSQDGMNFSKLGFMVTATIDNVDVRSKSVSSWSSGLLFTITNEHARPKITVQCPTFMCDGQVNPDCGLQIGTNGEVRIITKSYAFSGGSTAWGGRVTMTYIAKDSVPLNNPVVL